MKRINWKSIIVFFAVLLVGVAFLCIYQTDVVKYDYTEGEYLYQLQANDEISLIETKYNLELISLGAHQIATFQAKPGADMAKLIANGFTLNANNYSFAPPWQSSTDPYLKDQYALTMTNTIEAWTLEPGDASITVAIIDSGIDIYHDEFTGRISALSYNTLTNQTGLEAVEDDSGHGTMVAGIIGAIKDNSKGIAGIAQNVKLMVIKANNPGEGTFQDSSIVEAIYYAVDYGADIINLSLGGTYPNPLTKTAVAYAVNHGVAVVGAAGNDGTDELIYPASFPDVISVSAVSSDRTISDYSNFGEEIDIAAPGTEIVTTAMDNGYASVSGTSFAAPQVSGILALLFSFDPDVTIPELKTRLFGTAVDAGIVGRDDYFGYGIVNTYFLLTRDFAKVSFETYAGTDIDPIWVLKNTKFSFTETPILAEHIFTGWYKDALLTDDWIQTQDVVLSDMTLYAKYTSSFHTVTFVTDGTNAGEITIPHEGTFTLPETDLDGYEFVGWYLDSGYNTPFVIGIVTTDLSLYAKFSEIIYYDVNLYALNELYDTLSVRDGESVTLPSLDIAGYTYAGWYLEETFATQYPSGIVTSDLNLYAKLDIIYFDVTLEVPGSPDRILQVAYGVTPDFPDVTASGYVFAGWYYDFAYLHPYTNIPVTDDFTLYARFETQAYSVTVIIPFQTQYIIYVPYGGSLDINDPVKEGYDFAGWFLDQGYLNPFATSVITSNLTIYAKLDRIWLDVKFYGANNTTVIASQTIEYGHDAVAPTSPVKTATTAFNYVFISWSEGLTNVITDLNVYPEYDNIFKPSSVVLLSGIDTIFVGGTWTNGGVSVLDSQLSYTVVESVDEATAGRYVVAYNIMYNQEQVYKITRIVNVIELEANVVITLNPGITTIIVGDTYVDAGATTDFGTIEVIGEVNTAIAGVYEITYRVQINGWMFEKTRYVYVVGVASAENVFFVNKKEDDIYEI